MHYRTAASIGTWAFWMRAVGFASLLATLTGCATDRYINISTRPPDAAIRVDAVDVGKGPVRQKITFNDAAQVHHVTASRPFYKDTTISITRDDGQDSRQIDLKPLSRRVTINVVPPAESISVDGRPQTTGELTAVLPVELEFPPDPRNPNAQITHVVHAERKGFQPAETTVSYGDRESAYSLQLQNKTKDLSISTAPAGAQVYLDDELIGATVANAPVKVSQVPFRVNLDTGEWLPRTLKLTKNGYNPVQVAISWDDGKTDYAYDLAVKQKTVRIVTDPPGAVVSIDGVEYPRNASGVTVANLLFPPTNDNGDLQLHKAIASKKTAESEWEQTPLQIAWDDGKPDYSVTLKEIITRPSTLLSASPERGDEGWEIIPHNTPVVAMKDITEGPRRQPPEQITRLPKGTMIDTLTVSPDGSQILFTILSQHGKSDLRSQMVSIHTDVSNPGLQYLTDGGSLDLTPSYRADGKQIIFASNRGSRRMSVWMIAADGSPNATQYTTGEATSDLWPTLDSDPQQHLFYEALVDTRPDPRVYMTQLGTVTRTDLTYLGGTQPKISPKGDVVLFMAVNDRTGKRDLYRMPATGGVPENVTNSPDVDEMDPVWSADGSKIAFASDRGVNGQQRSYDIWIMDLAHPDRQTQITTNGSRDDCPAWDPSGSAIYFRSNRGGEWNIWKAAVR